MNTGSSFFHDLIADGRHGVRQMLRRPGFSAIVLLALGLGIGATVALLTVVDGLLLRPLPYRDESRVQVFWMDYSWRGEEYDFLKQRPGLFQQLAAFSTDGATYTPSDRATEAASVLTFVVSTSTFFDVLGVRPFLGRTYDANDDRPTAAPVVVVSHGVWQQDFAGDPHVIGRRIMLDGKPVTVIGVMPKGFFFPTPNIRAWRPLQLDPTNDSYTNGWLTFIARTPPGATAAQVSGEMKRLAGLLGGRFTYPAAWDKTKNASAVLVHDYLLGNVRQPMLLLLGAVALLFLIACANAAALILARATDRSGEFAVRTALGAGSWRLARQMLAESLVMALGAAVAGSLLATVGFHVLVTRLSLEDGMDSVLATGWTTFVAAFALGLIIALGVSVVPVRHLMSGRLGNAVNRERSDAGLRRGARRAHSAIIAAQVTFAVLLVVGATLLIRSVERIRAGDPGFDPRGVTTYTLFTGSGMSPEATGQLFHDMVARVAALPGVAAAGVTNRLPLRDLGSQAVVRAEGRPDLDGPRRPNVLYRTASPGFFAAMGMRVVAGRGMDSADVTGTLPVALISESFARAMWPGQSAVGRHIIEGWDGAPVSRTVVGVVRETRLTSMTAASPFVLWVPFDQSQRSVAVLEVRSGVTPATMMPQVRKAIGSFGANVAIFRAQTMDDVMSASLATPLRLRFFFSAFAALALALGAIGVYGVVSYAVARRRPEFAVRMALGASPQVVARQVIAFGLAPVAFGIAAGTVASIGAARLISTFLYGIAATDTASFAAAALTLLAVGAAAALVPAFRAGRTSPVEALKAGDL